MSIEKRKGLFFATCDRCHRSLVGRERFMDAVADKKAAGWKACSTESGWKDRCDKCLIEIKLLKAGYKAGEGLKKRR